MSEPPPPLLVLYDGECGLCQWGIRRLVKWDRRGRLRFAPLQGETAARVLSRQAGLDGIKSVLFVKTEADGSQQVWKKSAAVLRAIGYCGAVARLAGVLLLVPAFLRDLVYDFIARRRYRWCGKDDSCPIPAPGMRERFLP
ncbi:MAG: DCC1-like thiol-disulfide oxidoreductase family protein [Chthoniobacteraceae bacterium]